MEFGIEAYRDSTHKLGRSEREALLRGTGQATGLF